jgi:hypothetical protein
MYWHSLNKSSFTPSKVALGFSAGLSFTFTDPKYLEKISALSFALTASDVNTACGAL